MIISLVPPKEPFRAVPQSHPWPRVRRHHGNHHGPLSWSWEQRGRVPGQPDLRVLWVRWAQRSTGRLSLCDLCMSTHVYTCSCACSHTCTHVPMYVCTYVHMFAHMYTYFCACSHIGLPTCMLCVASLIQTPFWSHSTSAFAPHVSQGWILLKIMKSEPPELLMKKAPGAVQTPGHTFIRSSLWLLEKHGHCMISALSKPDSPSGHLLGLKKNEHLLFVKYIEWGCRES